MNGMHYRRLVTLAACAVFVAAALVPSARLFDATVAGDSFLYQTYGEQMVHGQIPYHDFFMEYPPGAIPAFLAPAVAGAAHYAQLWKILMLACALGCLVLVSVVLRQVGAGRRRTVAALALVALSPLLLGSVLTTHYDPWPALLATLALALLLGGRPKSALFVLGIAAAAKVYPIVLAPLAIVYILRHRGAREAGRATAALAGGLLVCLAPFAVVGAGGLRFSLEFETRRPLQIESLGSALLLAAHHLGVYTAHPISTYNSANLAGALPRGVAAVTAVLTVCALLAVWALFARGPADPESLLTASACALVAYVALGKVLSPQYMVWLVPFVPLVAGRTGLVAGALLAVALVCTQALLHWKSIGLGAADWVVLSRDLLLVAMLVVLAIPLVRGVRPRPSAVPGASART